MLLERGARNLILLSRSGKSLNEEQEIFLRELESARAEVVVKKCDVVNGSQLSQVIKDCKKTMPPIKGMTQSATILSVSGGPSQARETS